MGDAGCIVVNFIGKAFNSEFETLILLMMLCTVLSEVRHVVMHAAAVSLELT
jgi:hypothetical protein